MQGQVMDELIFVMGGNIKIHHNSKASFNKQVYSGFHSYCKDNQHAEMPERWPRAHLASLVAHKSDPNFDKSHNFNGYRDDSFWQ